MFAYFAIGFGLGFPAAAQPGSFQVYLLAQTVKNGWRRTLPAAFAPLLSDGPIVALVLLVLTQAPDWLLYGLQVGGGCFLLYLAADAWRMFRHLGDEVETAVIVPPTTDTAQKNLLQAAFMNFLNPNPYIFWSTLAGPILINAWRERPLYGLGFLLGFYGTLIVGFMGFIVLFALTNRLDGRVRRWLSGVSALLLLGFGLYQIVTGLAAII